jgi:hypothetical protein
MKPLGLVLVVAAFGWSLTVLPDRPPLAHTGGFGEPTCLECHFDDPINDKGGVFTLAGVPDRYEPGKSYPITVRLGRKEIARGGFELSTRIAEGPSAGHQAGRLEATDNRVNLADSTRADVGAVQYARHNRAGSDVGKTDTLEWVVKWTAPASAAGAVIFHAAGNAANDDNSPLGDYIYTTTATAR